MNDLLRPTTDAGVFLQFALVLLVVGLGLVLTRRRPDGRLVVIGAGMLALGVMGLRAVH